MTPTHAIATPEFRYQWQVFYPNRVCVMVGDTAAKSVVIEGEYRPADDAKYSVPLASVPAVVWENARQCLAAHLARGAAGELLAVLKRVRDILYVPEPLCAQVSAAIAKAEGRQ